ncbi:hypothetical protein VNO78_08624 [Psophocarpus tetragonolobus]|uniref:Uncharacterized protein n=1 Tax=Psophocarpus tetragonolobus TaxID=3891 RepID=A0AAN9XTX4_PSOTE
MGHSVFKYIVKKHGNLWLTDLRGLKVVLFWLTTRMHIVRALEYMRDLSKPFVQPVIRSFHSAIHTPPQFLTLQDYSSLFLATPLNSLVHLDSKLQHSFFMGLIPNHSPQIHPNQFQFQFNSSLTNRPCHAIQDVVDPTAISSTHCCLWAKDRSEDWNLHVSQVDARVMKEEFESFGNSGEGEVWVGTGRRVWRLGMMGLRGKEDRCEWDVVRRR